MSGAELDNFLLGGNYAPANFLDAEESRPVAASLEALGGSQDAIQGIVAMTMTRHLSEALPQYPPSPSLNSNNWRKRLREMMIRQNETVLQFLMKPLGDHATLGPVEQALRRYAIREDIDNNSIKNLKTVLLADISGSQLIQTEIESSISTKGPSSQLQLRAQVNAMIELYRETGEKLLECENQLKLRLEKMDKVRRRVSTIIELQTNDGTDELVSALEKYLKISFRDMTVEPYYKNLLYLYQKHMALREAITIFKAGSQVVNEPICPICLTESVNHAIVPCGHTFCGTCARRMTMECGVCRGRIRERMKLYFS